MRVFSFLIFSFLTACSAESDQFSTKSDVKETSNDAASAYVANVDFGGAEIGDKIAIEKAQSCIGSGKFYDRTSTSKNPCTTAELARINCRQDALKQAMSARTKAAFETLQRGELADYQLDQCIDCSAIRSRKVCQESSGRNNLKSGIMVTFVKQTGSSVDVRVVVIP